jgi:hypothetical protein
MTDAEQARVEDFYTRTENSLQSEGPDVRLSLANEIGVWEAGHLADLDSGTVDQLDAAQDHLRNGMPQTEAAKSSLVAGLKSWWDDPNKLDTKNLKDSIANALPGGWTPWLIGLGALALLIAVGYAARGVGDVKAIARG